MGLELNGANIPEPDPPAAAIDAAHLDRQRTWSENTFGPYPRLAGVVDHIRKELVEVVDSGNDLSEWVDVLMLAFDGACGTGASSQEIIDALQAKLAVNEALENAYRLVRGERDEALQQLAYLRAQYKQACLEWGVPGGEK
ncbi:DUF550 domain-containing protein [Mycolicibacterium canariasense]|nr:DUF550 domain-containing protein [Mycolicibacterium canariasense]